MRRVYCTLTILIAVVLFTGLSTAGTLWILGDAVDGPIEDLGISKFIILVSLTAYALFVATTGLLFSIFVWVKVATIFISESDAAHILRQTLNVRSGSFSDRSLSRIEGSLGSRVTDLDRGDWQ